MLDDETGSDSHGPSSADVSEMLSLTVRQGLGGSSPEAPGTARHGKKFRVAEDVDGP